MDKVRKESYRVRAVSVGFAVLALIVFKTLGLSAWQWETYAHMLAIFVLGCGVCLLTEAILKYMVRMPRSLEQGVGYIIRRNLWFQLINTPLISLMICLYRHFFLGGSIPANQLSWGNFFETLLIMTFISFAMGLYWRFKFRSRYLAAELEETRLLNEQLQALQQETDGRAKTTEMTIAHTTAESPTLANHVPTPTRVTLTGTTAETLTLQISDLLYVEAVGNYVKVYHLHNGLVRTDMLRATSKQMEDELRMHLTIVRCHRAFLVNLQQVEQIVSRSGSIQLLIKHSHDSIPVSRSNMSDVKEALKNEKVKVKKEK